MDLQFGIVVKLLLCPKFKNWSGISQSYSTQLVLIHLTAQKIDFLNQLLTVWIVLESYINNKLSTKVDTALLFVFPFRDKFHLCFSRYFPCSYCVNNKRKKKHRHASWTLISFYSLVNRISIKTHLKNNK